MDNGAYEGAVNISQLESALMLYQPNVCALPDALFQHWTKTYHDSFEFLDRHYKTYPNTEWMYIPQTTKTDIMGFMEGLFKALEDVRIKWIGLPRALGIHYTHDPLMRVNICKWLKEKTGVKVHAMGMQDGSIAEFKMLELHGCTSCDSSAPVWRGWNGVRLGAEWKDIPVDFEATLPHDDVIIYDNLKELRIHANCVRERGPVQRQANVSR